MPRRSQNIKPIDSTVLGARRELASRISAITGKAGEHFTAIPEVVLYNRDEPTSCYRASYEPSLSIFVQGRKHILLGETEYVCDASSFLLSSIDVPARSQIVEASQKTPLLVMFLRFDMPTVREILARDHLPEVTCERHGQGFAVGDTTVGLLDACKRLLALLDTPEDIPF